MEIPEIKGNLEIAIVDDDVFVQGIFIGGDPEGLRSLAQQLLWLAQLNQDEALEVSNEVREHFHLRPNVTLSGNSSPAEICRLDAKITGAFPEDFVPAPHMKKRRKRA